MKRINSEITKNAVLFSLTIHQWTNSGKVDKNLIQTGMDKAALSARKRLVNSDEYKRVGDFLGSVYDWCQNRSMRSGLRSGLNFVRRDQIGKFATYIEQANITLKEQMVPPLQRAMPELIKQAREDLKEQFDERDYPTNGELERKYGIEYAILELGVPDDLPKEVAEREAKKLEAAYKSAQEEVLYALREGFKAMVSHAVDRLAPTDTGKPRVFRDTLVENFREFFDCFSAKNIMNDGELSQLVEKAKAVIGNVKPEELRESVTIRNAVATEFKRIDGVLDKLVADRPSRRFQLDD